MSEETTLKQCPYCTETINPNAKVCKHCGRTIDVVLQAAEQAQNNSGPIIVNNNNNNNNNNNAPNYPPKSRLSYILLAIFLGGLGVHNFYASRTGSGIAQLLLNLFFFWTVVIPIIVGVWILIEIFVVNTDGHGVRMS